MKNQDVSTKYEFKISESATLLKTLFALIKDQSRTTIKSYLSHRQVSINNVITTKHDAAIKQGDIVRVRMGRAPEEFKHPMMRIVYEDQDIIIIDKRNGLLSMASSKQQTKTAYFILSEYVKRKDPQNRIFILHRLDRETSGLMMFAKSEQVQETMQRGWHNLVRERKYIAVVEGHLPQKQGSIHTLLTENAALKMYVPRDDENKGEEAITNYRVVR
ncbi:MAG: pseudouridine synthase, partial [Rikenellaceae bacterium]